MLNKRIFSFTLTVLLCATFVVTASENPTQTKAVTMPDDVKAIVKNSCFGCHNTDSKNEDGKKALDFKTLDSLSPTKMIKAFKEMDEVLEKNEMPPKKFLAKYPDKKLSDADRTVLMDWANKEAKALMK